MKTIRAYLDRFDNLVILFGRNGPHRYNNQDHWTGTGYPRHPQSDLEGDENDDVRSINTEADYLEEGEVVDGKLLDPRAQNVPLREFEHFGASPRRRKPAGRDSLIPPVR